MKNQEQSNRQDENNGGFFRNFFRTGPGAGGETGERENALLDSARTSTPESRASQEIHPDYRDSLPVVDQTYDAVMSGSPGTDAGHVGAVPYDALTGHLSNAGHRSDTSLNADTPATLQSAHPSTHGYLEYMRDDPSYDYYRQHLYDEYYLQDDYYYQDDYYPQHYHDSPRYDHHSYEYRGYISDYGPADYGYRESRPATEAFVAPASAAVFMSQAPMLSEELRNSPIDEQAGLLSEDYRTYQVSERSASLPLNHAWPESSVSGPQGLRQDDYGSLLYNEPAFASPYPASYASTPFFQGTEASQEHGPSQIPASRFPSKASSEGFAHDPISQIPYQESVIANDAKPSIESFVQNPMASSVLQVSAGENAVQNTSANMVVQNHEQRQDDGTVLAPAVSAAGLQPRQAEAAVMDAGVAPNRLMINHSDDIGGFERPVQAPFDYGHHPQPGYRHQDPMAIGYHNAGILSERSVYAPSVPVRLQSAEPLISAPVLADHWQASNVASSETREAYALVPDARIADSFITPDRRDVAFSHAGEVAADPVMQTREVLDDSVRHQLQNQSPAEASLSPDVAARHDTLLDARQAPSSPFTPPLGSPVGQYASIPLGRRAEEATGDPIPVGAGHAAISPLVARSAVQAARQQLEDPAGMSQSLLTENRTSMLEGSGAKGILSEDVSVPIHPELPSRISPAASPVVQNALPNMPQSAAEKVAAAKVSSIKGASSLGQRGAVLDQRSAVGGSKDIKSPLAEAEHGTVGQAGKPTAKDGFLMAGAVSAGVIGLAGQAAFKGVVTAGSLARDTIVRSMREDEDLSRIADGRDILIDAEMAMRKAPSGKGNSLKEALSPGRIAEDRLMKEASATNVVSDKAQVLKASADPSGISSILAPETNAEAMDALFQNAPVGHAAGIGHAFERDASSAVKEPRLRKMESIGLHEKEGAAQAKAVLLDAKASEKGLDARASVLADGPTGIQKEAEAAARGKSAESLLIDPEADGPAKTQGHVKEKGKEGKGEKGKSGHKRPVTEREKEHAAKKDAIKRAKLDSGGNKSKAMSVVKGGEGIAVKGVLFTAGAAKSSAKKALASKDEGIAATLSMAQAGKQVYRGARMAVKVPVRIYQATRAAVHAVAAVAKAIWSTIATASLGSWLVIPALVLLVVLFAFVIILFGTATIVNDEQEISEVSALVAELDEDLTEEIGALGAQSILYANAENTYEFEEDGEKTTIDADLSDEESDLEEVLATSVTVRTNADAVVAYIDAKYSGKWQVGAASWKYTIDAFGVTWSVIDWDNVPEFVQKAINKLDRVQFTSGLSYVVQGHLAEDLGVDEETASGIAAYIADEVGNIVYDQQIQGASEEVFEQVIRDAVKKHRSELELSDDQAKKLYYRLSVAIADMIGEEEPVALVYDEIVELHEKLNFWSEDYESVLAEGGGSGLTGGTIIEGTASGGNNKYGYPNSSGYDASLLSSWDGFNEASIYGVSEAGTTGTLGDGTSITNTWADTNMAIACEGLQNDIFAYWTSGYKAATGISSPVPVKITLYNPSTGQTVTAEVRDCGGWRGFNANYAGLNADRQWDLLPAVWKALGGTEASGVMKVYWRVDPNATVGGGAALRPVTIEGYEWPEETDGGNDEITVTRPTFVAHGVHDLLNNAGLFDEMLDEEAYATQAQFKAVRSLVHGKVQTVMRSLLTMDNSVGDSYIDYLYFRRDLGNPFGKTEGGDQNDWIVTERYNPGYDDFDHDEAFVKIKPLSNVKTVRAVKKGWVKKISDGKVTIISTLDSADSIKIDYSDLTDISVKEGDEVKNGTRLGKMSGSELRIAYYEVDDPFIGFDSKKDWAYNGGYFMLGFAGYEALEDPIPYTGVGGTRSYEDCQTIIEFAYSRLGCPYVWGATGPVTFDCSGLTQWCYAKCGITIPRTSSEQYAAAATRGAARPVNEATMQPGDILWKSGHVGLYIGNNQYIHAPTTGDVVKVSTGVHYFTHSLSFG